MGKLPLLLLPGTLCDARLFEYQVEHLADIVTPMVVDVHLHDNLPDVARYVLSQVTGKFAVVGLSYGGIIAFELWRQAPDRIHKMALLDTTPYPPSAETKAKQQRFVGMAHLGEFREITTDFLKDVMLHPDHRKDIQLRQKILEMAESIGIDGFINEIKAQLHRPDSSPDMPSITCPTLILTGKEDQVTTVEIHQAMHKAIPNSRLKIIDHCGHLSTMEQPEIVTSTLREWLVYEQGK